MFLGSPRNTMAQDSNRKRARSMDTENHKNKPSVTITPHDVIVAILTTLTMSLLLLCFVISSRSCNKTEKEKLEWRRLETRVPENS